METSLLSKSPWSHDQIHSFISGIHQDFTMSSLCTDDNPRNKGWDDSSLHSTATSTLSSASSECDEDLLLFPDEDLGVNSFDNELFNDIGGWLSGPSIQDQICGNNDWINPPIQVSDSPISSSPSPSPPSSPRKRQPIDVLSSNMSWSSMNEDLRLQTMEALSEIISSKLDLREQLEIIKIIDSKAVISPTDTEFAINLDCLNDEKLEMFKTFIKKSIAQKNSQKSNHVNNVILQSHTYHKTKMSKKEIAKEKKNELKAAKQRRKKEYRQLLKEKRSGLFVKEEVLALSCTPNDDEDIDIDIGEERF